MATCYKSFYNSGCIQSIEIFEPAPRLAINITSEDSFHLPDEPAVLRIEVIGDEDLCGTLRSVARELESFASSLDGCRAISEGLTGDEPMLSRKQTNETRKNSV